MTYQVIDLFWKEKIKGDFTSIESAKEWLDCHSGSEKECRAVADEHGHVVGSYDANHNWSEKRRTPEKKKLYIYLIR